MKAILKAGWLALAACSSIVVLTGCSSKETPSNIWAFSGESVVVPIKFINKRPTVAVMVNGRGPYTLLLDTGAASILLSKKIVEKLELPHVGDTLFTNAAGEKAGSREFGAGEIEIGEAAVSMVAVQEIEFYETPGMDGFDGILGMHNFGDLAVTIDFPGEKLHVRKQVESDAAPNWIPIETKHNCPEIPLKIGGKTTSFLVDTGSDASLTVEESTTLGLPLYKRQFEGVGAVVGSKTLKWNLTTRLDAIVMLGQYPIERPYISWFANAPGRNLIGMEILRHFRIDLDLENDRIRFFRNETSPLNFPDTRRLGIDIVWNPEDKTYRVSRFGTYRDAISGLEIGDRILAIDDQPMQEITGEVLNELVWTKERLEFSAERDGKSFVVDVPIHVDSFE